MPVEEAENITPVMRAVPPGDIHGFHSHYYQTKFTCDGSCRNPRRGLHGQDLQIVPIPLSVSFGGGCDGGDAIHQGANCCGGNGGHGVGPQPEAGGGGGGGDVGGVADRAGGAGAADADVVILVR